MKDSRKSSKTNDLLCHLYSQKDPEFQQSPYKRRLNRWITIFLFGYFAIFLIPESFWKSVIDSNNTSIFPDVIAYTIEKSLFPASAYAFWIIMPIFLLITFCISVAMLWPLGEFEKFLVRRERVKGIVWVCLIVIAVFIWLPHVHSPSNVIYSLLQPLKYKITFFALYGGGTLCESAALAALLAELRARFWFKKH